MASIMGNAAVAGLTALLLAGCTQDALGPEYREVSEQESGLRFDAPGLEGGYRKVLKGQDERYVNRTMAVYGPQQGEYPRGQLVLIEMPPERHFARVDTPQDTIRAWSIFEDRKIVLGPTGTAVNAIGRIDYAAFRADDVSCVIFNQPFGTIYDTGRGTRLLEGYYCKGPARMMSAAEAASIVKGVGRRETGTAASAAQ